MYLADTFKGIFECCYHVLNCLIASLILNVQGENVGNNIYYENVMLLMKNIFTTWLGHAACYRYVTVSQIVVTLHSHFKCPTNEIDIILPIPL
jgi:hypothetical protein